MGATKAKYMVVAVLTDSSKGVKEVVGYRVLDLKTGEQTTVPKPYLEGKQGGGMLFTNLQRKEGSNKIKGSFDEYPIYDIGTGQVVENKDAKLVIFEGIEDSGVSKKVTYQVMDIRGRTEWLEADDIIRFYQGEIANMSIVTPKQGKRYLRRLKNQYIPTKSVVPEYTQKVFTNKNKEEGMVSQWLVRMIKTGEPYGLNLSLTNDKAALVEFIDANTLQFVSRYYKTTIEEGEGGTGLSLNGEVPAWRVTKETMCEIREWLKEKQTEKEI